MEVRLLRNGLCRLHGVMRRLIAACFVILFLAGSVQAEDMRIIVAIRGKNLYAVLEDNPASQALYKVMPFTIRMKNLYGREMRANLPITLPVQKLSANSYSVGDIVYWPPRHSLMIIYRQKGERFRRQHLGRIESGAEVLATTEDTEVTFAPAPVY